jgi:hypothetical protein
MHRVLATPSGGDTPQIATTTTYNGTADQATVLFDTGTSAISVIEDPNAKNTTILPANSAVSLKTTSGFTYR